MSAPDRPQGLTREDAFRILGALGAILTLLTALLFYFGWRRSEAQSRAMGIDVTLFGYSSQDYVLRSISSLYLPLLVLAAGGLLWVRLHRALAVRVESLGGRGRSRATQTARWAGRLAAAVAAITLAFTVAAGTSDPWAPVDWLAGELSDTTWVIPLVLVGCVVVGAYSSWLRRALGVPLPDAANPWTRVLAAAMVSVVVVLSLFWLLEEYAAAVGRGYAQSVVARVPDLPRATVTGPTPLDIDAPGVTEGALSVEGSDEIQFRTQGLRLLARSGTKIILVHDDWSPETGVVIVLPDSDAYTWQFSR